MLDLRIEEVQVVVMSVTLLFRLTVWYGVSELTPMLFINSLRLGSLHIEINNFFSLKKHN